MRHFSHLTDGDRARLFLRPPRVFSRDEPPDVLAVALGATLYIPANRPTLDRDIAAAARRGVVSAVLCLEDAIADEDVGPAEANVVATIARLSGADADGPLLFVRVRTPEQVRRIVDNLGDNVGMLSGFVFPKFTECSGERYLDELAAASTVLPRPLFAMPILESSEVIFGERREASLIGVHGLLDKHRERVLAVRIGATDLSALYGIRRSRDLTIYDVRLIADVIGDVVNVLGRTDGTGFVVAGTVWEYFPPAERYFKPQLRETPFLEHMNRALRAELVAHNLDGLIREVLLDKANGLTGKTVIHPSHVAPVHAMMVVSHEEYLDACEIASASPTGGVRASSYGNKMNEIRPHNAWAQRTLQRADIFGVAASDVSFVDLLSAGTDS
jgi:citrate lyase beta subunit